MTDNRMALLEMAENAGETDSLRELILEVVQELMEAKVDGRCGAVGIFPNEDAIRRLVGAVVLEQSDEWQVGRCYMAQHSLASLSEPNEAKPKEIEQAA